MDTNMPEADCDTNLKGGRPQKDSEPTSEPVFPFQALLRKEKCGSETLLRKLRGSRGKCKGANTGTIDRRSKNGPAEA